MLVVDPDRASRRLLARAAARCASHSHVSEAGDLQHALAALAADHYDLVVTELRLPDGDFADLSHVIRHSTTRPSPELVVVTADVPRAHRDARYFAQLGVIQVLTKPIDLGDIIRLVHRHVSPEQSTRPSKIAACPPPGFSAGTP